TGSRRLSPPADQVRARPRLRAASAQAGGTAANAWPGRLSARRADPGPPRIWSAPRAWSRAGILCRSREIAADVLCRLRGRCRRVRAGAQQGGALRRLEFLTAIPCGRHPGVRAWLLAERGGADRVDPGVAYTARTSDREGCCARRAGIRSRDHR